MFYCESCRSQEGFPPTLGPKSEGPCEICGKVAICNDVKAELVTDPEAYARVESVLIAKGGQKVLDAIRSDAPAEETERLMAEFLAKQEN